MAGDIVVSNPWLLSPEELAKMPDDWGFEVPIYYYRDLSTMAALVRSRKMREMMKVLRELRYEITVEEDIHLAVYAYRMHRTPRPRQKLDGSIDI